MNEDKESLHDALEEPGSQAEEAPMEGEAELAAGDEFALDAELGAMADALLQADIDSPYDVLVADPPLGEVATGEDNPDAAAAVEEMLSAAMLEEVAGAASEVSTDLGLAPTFQLKINIPRNASREGIKKIASDLGLSLPEASLVSETPIISQLNEYQAVVFLQQLRAIGLSATVDLRRPSFAPNEEDLALGGLAEVPDATSITSEGAPAVKLPGTERGVLLYSGESLPAFPISQTLGVVTAHRSLARRFFRDDELDEKLRREMEKIPGRTASNIPRSRLEGIFRELFLDLQKAALGKGGNAVLGVRIETFAESSSLDPSLEQMRLVAFGTAAVVEKWDP